MHGLASPSIIIKTKFEYGGTDIIH